MSIEVAVNLYLKLGLVEHRDYVLFSGKPAVSQIMYLYNMFDRIQGSSLRDNIFPSRSNVLACKISTREPNAEDTTQLERFGHTSLSSKRQNGKNDENRPKKGIFRANRVLGP